ncbi:hypothetical protein D3C80_2164190 [compost metagenome]
MKLAIGRFDRIARYAEGFGEHARSWKRLSRPKRTVEDQLPDRPLDARMKRHPSLGGLGNPCLHGLELGMLEQMV